jgi:hypothetical protein
MTHWYGQKVGTDTCLRLHERPRMDGGAHLGGVK